jgi:hypothetical protein
MRLPEVCWFEAAPSANEGAGMLAAMPAAFDAIGPGNGRPDRHALQAPT